MRITPHLEAEARAACEALCAAHGALADAARADDFAALYASDGVFDRLGQQFAGREAIRQVIARRAPGVWTRHHCRNVRITVAPDGRSAGGTVDFEMERGQTGVDHVEHLRGVYTDRFALTDEGWKFQRRTVQLLT